MSKMQKQIINKQSFITPKDQLGYAEEYIVVKFDDKRDSRLLNYSLSNNLDDIEIAIYSRTGQIINLEEAHWQMNPFLSTSVKHLMNSHHVNYSMTILDDEADKSIIVNMRVGDKWFFSSYRQINSPTMNGGVLNPSSRIKKINMDLLTETNIYIRGLGILKIFLSNDFIDILNSYINQTGNSVCFKEEIKWKSNNKLFKSIKDIMNEYNVSYSIVHYMKGESRIILINKRTANKWYTLFYSVKPSEAERTQYFKKKYHFSFYTGCFLGFIGFILYKLLGIRILQEKYYRNIG
jgi:hypothetical protein